MKKRKNSTDGRPNAPEADDEVRTDEETAPSPEPLAAPPSSPETNSLAFPDPRDSPDPPAVLVEPAPPVADFDAPPPSLSPPAWPDFPVASVLPPVAPLLHPPVAPTPLEDRLQRLEAELASLRNSQGTEPRTGGVQAAAPDPAAGVVRKPGAFWFGLGQRMLTPSGPASAPPPRSEGLASMVPAGVRRTWIFLDALTELRAMYWMYFDPRYRLSWTARMGPLAILALILTSSFWTPAVGLCSLGWIVDKVVDLVLAYLLFKLLSYEARRYRETAPDLPPGLRQ